ncbi:MAG: acyl-ACP thioesterase [Mailhella sp.]|nr:acyl-ACP thioesterase [Mailhella sp.]
MPIFDDRFSLSMDFHVRYGEAGSDGTARLSSVADWLQEAAAANAEEHGFGDAFMRPLGVTWVLTRLCMRIKRLPSTGETVTVHTWPSRFGRMADRGYELYDSGGSLIAECGSTWAVMDLAGRTMTRPPEALRGVFPEDGRPVLPCTASLPRVAEICGAAKVLVRREDLDVNGHVNNAHYLSWLFEGNGPEDSASACRGIPVFLDMAFRSECLPGDELESVRAAAARREDGLLAVAHAIRRGGSDVCRALTLWRA